VSQYVDFASESVIWENIGGQIVTANMNTGVYCNVESGTGVVLWCLLLSGLNVDEVVLAMQQHYQALPADFLEQLHLFINRLITANIWKFSETARSYDKSFSRMISDYDDSSQYKNPIILAYDDIDTLLQIDPIDDELVDLIHAEG